MSRNDAPHLVPHLALAFVCAVLTGCGGGGSSPSSTVPGGGGGTGGGGSGPTPSIAQIVPDNGAPGDQVVIFGTDFAPRPADNTVRFDNAIAQVLLATSDQLTVLVPTLSPGVVAVTVEVAGRRSTAASFTVNSGPPQPPAITGVAPTFAPPGATVQVDGSGFGASPTVTVGNQPATVVSAGPNRLTFIVPNLPVGQTTLVVTGPGGASSPVAFTVTSNTPPATLVRIDPPGGVPGQLVTLRGEGFGAGSAPVVRFGTTAASVIDFNDRSVAVRVPSLLPRSYSVTLTPAGAASSNAIPFVVAAPASGAASPFTQVRSMNTARTAHTATLLADGRVLVVGGDATGGLDGLASGEVYDPGADRWDTVSNTMQVPRQGHTATRLPDGRVLIAGGFGKVGAGVTIHRSTEIWDPATGRFSPGPDMITPRSGHVAVVLADGDVLLAGGESVGTLGGLTGPIRECEYYRFDPNGGPGSFDPAPPLQLARLLAAALPSFGGAVVVGGMDLSSELASLEVLDRNAGAWTLGGNGFLIMNAPRVSPTIVRLASNDIALAGGYSPSGLAGVFGIDPFTTIEYLVTDPNDPAAGIFQLRSFPQLPPRVGHSMTRLADDRVLLVGSAADANAARSATIFDPGMTSGQALSGAGGPVAARFDHTATLLFDGRVLLAGGGGDSSALPGVFGIVLPVTQGCETFTP